MPCLSIWVHFGSQMMPSLTSCGIKRVINAMVKEIAGKSCADGALTETGKKQKEIIRNRMAGHGVSADKARPDWRPRWMQVPATHYLDKATCPPASAAARVAKCMPKPESTEKAA